MKKLLKAVLVIGVIAFLAGLIIILGLRIYYSSFFEEARKEFTIPALEDNFVPQGFEYCENENLFLISGYISNTNQAKLCVIEPNGDYKILSFLDEHGNTLFSHSGGICQSNRFIYLAGCDGICYVFSIDEITQENIQDIQAIGCFETYNDASFCTVKDNYLFVGEYYFPLKYHTDALHQFISQSGEEHNAVVTVFSLDDKSPLGVCEIPELALSITDRIQGMCFNGDKLIMSASSIFKGSQLYVYDYQSATSDYEDTILIDENEVPLYFIGSDNLLNTMEILPKSEEPTIYGDRLFLLYESASNKFKYGKWLDSDYTYSMPLSLLEK